MSVLLTLLRIGLWIIEAGLAIVTGYLLLLTACALFAPRRTPARPAQAPRWTFQILVPAHNEEKLLPDLLANLRRLDYPSDLYAVHVVADNCTDRTAEVARQGGAIVHERRNPDLRGKGYALNWLIEQLAVPATSAAGRPAAIVIIDADTIISENFLTVMDARLARGDRAIQAYYAVRDPASSWTVSLRYIALAVLHFLRPQGRMVLGGSAGLKGNGMVFCADILARHRWSASLTEDIEYHMALILAGERVAFAPDAVVWAEMPGTLAGSRTQNARWESGRLQMLRDYVPRLLSEAIRRRSAHLAGGRPAARPGALHVHRTGPGRSAGARLPGALDRAGPHHLEALAICARPAETGWSGLGPHHAQLTPGAHALKRRMAYG